MEKKESDKIGLFIVNGDNNGERNARLKILLNTTYRGKRLRLIA